MTTTTDEDELELEDQKKKAQQPIGKPIVGPTQAQTQGPASQPMPKPTAPSAPIGTPIGSQNIIPGVDSTNTPPSMPENAPTAQLPGAQSSIGGAIAPSAAQAVRNEGAGVNRVHGFGGGLLKALNGIGSAIAPGIMLNIPGTTMNQRGRVHDAEVQDREAQVAQEEQAKVGLQEAQARGADATAQQRMNRTPVTDKQGNTYYLDQAGLDKYAVSNAGNESKEGIASNRNDTQEDIASGKNTSAESIARGRETSQEKIARDRMESTERIAQGKNLVSTEVAKIRAQAGNDPNKLTMMMRTQKQQAQATLPAIDKALDETEKVAQLLGPGAGRWNQFMQGKIGISDPAFAHYADEIGMVSTAVTLAHARGRMSNELFEHFQKMFDAGKQAPENMIQALDVAKEWLGVYANMGEPGSPVGGGTGGGSNPVIHYKIQGGQLVPVPQTSNAGH